MPVLTDTDFDGAFHFIGTVHDRLERSAASGPGTDDEYRKAGARIVLSWMAFVPWGRKDLLADWLRQQSGPTYEGALEYLRRAYYEQEDARTLLRALGGYAGGCG